MTLRAWRISSPERIWAMAIALVCMTFLIALVIVAKWFDTSWTDTNTSEYVQPATHMEAATKHLQKKNASTAIITPSKPPVTTIKTPPKPVVVSAKKIPVRKEPSPPQTHSSQQISLGYFVQLGAFRDQQHALKLQARLKTKKIYSEIYSKKSLYVVLAGPYTTHAAANKAKKIFAANHHLEGFVTHR